MRKEIMLLVAFVLVIMVTRKYVSRIGLKTPDILAWQHVYSHGRLIDGAKDHRENEYSFCKNIDSRKIQVT